MEHMQAAASPILDGGKSKVSCSTLCELDYGPMDATATLQRAHSQAQGMTTVPDLHLAGAKAHPPKQLGVHTPSAPQPVQVIAAFSPALSSLSQKRNCKDGIITSSCSAAHLRPSRPSHQALSRLRLGAIQSNQNALLRALLCSRTGMDIRQRHCVFALAVHPPVIAATLCKTLPTHMQAASNVVSRSRKVAKTCVFCGLNDRFVGSSCGGTGMQLMQLQPLALPAVLPEPYYWLLQLQWPLLTRDLEGMREPASEALHFLSLRFQLQGEGTEHVLHLPGTQSRLYVLPSQLSGGSKKLSCSAFCSCARFPSMTAPC